MTCASCGSAAPEAAKFCPECGATLVAACSSCGTALVAGAKFCAECGTPVTAQAAAGTTRSGTGAFPGVAPQAVAERRVVTILFADLVGFTTLAEGRDAEAVRELLSRYFDVAQEIVARYGGTIEKFIGDAVMAVWGTPVAREDDAERAVRAALDLVDAVRHIGPELQARAAVLTGEAAVTLGATNQGMVAGDIVNTASRLQSVAPPGSVLVGEATMRAADSAIAFEPVGETLLKGKVAPVPAHRALRVIAERGGRGRQGGLEAPFVGRDDEYRLLRELIHATTREARPRLVSITGQAGVGKSRMTWELSKYLDGVVEQIYWHSGRSPAYGEGVTFWALGEIVRSRAGLAETDDEARTRERIAQTVARWVHDEAERDWIERALLTLLGVETMGSMAGEELFSAWRTFFERIAAEGTVLLVFEDLQWADPGLLDFIDHVLDWSKNAPIVIVTLARPDLLEWRPGFGAGRRNFVGLALEPLPAPAMHDLLAGLVPGLPVEATERIVARADGIPMYAVETVRMLVADGHIVEDQGTYRPVSDIATLAIPETLQALVAARLDALEPAERSLIQDAAVLGQTFTPAALVAVSGVDRDVVDETLRSLARREIVVTVADPGSPERGQVAFVQALVREVAYGTLARRDRRTRHMAAARYFEQLGEEELAGALATHYLAAYRASADDPEARALAAQARVALRGAAERAAALGSHDQAAAYFLEAIEVADDPSGVADLLERAGIEADNGGRPEMAREHLEAAIAAYQELGDRAAEARATGLFGQAIINSWRAADAIPPLTEAADRFADLGDDVSLAMIEHQLARAHWFVDDQAAGIQFVDRALVRAERIGAAGLIADALVTRGSILGDLGRHFEGMAVIRGGVALAEQLGLVATAVRGQLNLGGGLMDRDVRGSFDISLQTVALARSRGLRSSLATALGNATESAFHLGEWDWSTAESAAIIDELQPHDRRSLLRGRIEVLAARGEPYEELLAEHAGAIGGDSQDESNYYGSVAATRFAAGDMQAAAEAWSRSSILTPINETFDRPRAAFAWLLADRPADAQRLRADIVVSGASDALAAIMVDVVTAAFAGFEGRRDDAARGFDSALSRWHGVGVVTFHFYAGLLMARALGADDPRTVETARALRTRLTSLRATAWLALLDAAVPSVAPAAIPEPTEPPVGADAAERVVSA